MALEDLRVAVYRSFADTGGPPGRTSVASAFDVPEVEVDEGLRALARTRHVVLDSHDQVVMAHPFAAIPLGFSVMGATTLWWGGCAWDSFALPHLLPEQDPVLVATRCPNCGRPLAWDVRREAPPAGDEVAHVLVPVARIWDDVVHTAATRTSSARTGASSSGCGARATSVGTSWISRPCGASPPSGMPDGSTAGTSAASLPRPPTTSGRSA